MFFLKKKRLLSAVTAVAMCMSLTGTALAASLDDVQHAIDGSYWAGVLIENSDKTNHYGYGQNEDGSFGVEAWDEDDTRHVDLREDASYEGGWDHIEVNADQSVELNGNGNSINGTWWKSVVQVSGGELDLNDVTVSGGDCGVDAVLGAQVEINNSTITENERVQNIGDGTGSGIRADGSDTKVVINDSNIVNNTEACDWAHGGGIGVTGGASVIINGDSHVDNNKSDFGGGIYVKDGYVELNGGTVNGNDAWHSTGVGGGVLVDEGTFVMNGGEIAGNKATVAGGGIFTWENVEIHGGQITGNSVNTTDGDGGGVYIANGGNVDMTAGVISDNTAFDGGGVHLDEGSRFQMSGGEIVNNNAVYTGGGVVNLGDMTMTGGSVYGNTVATGDGGGIYVGGPGSLNMSDGVIADNAAAAAGGGIFSQGQVEISGGQITSNTAAGGGGICSAELGNLNMTDGEISNNTATGWEGGGVYITGKGSITGGDIIGNRTLTERDFGGGGIYIGADSSLKLNNAIVVGNYAGTAGGGVAGCVTSRVMIFGIDGAAIFGNMSGGLENYKGSNHNSDNVDTWSQFSDEEKEAFFNAAQDLYLAGWSQREGYETAGAVVGNVILGVACADPSNPTAEEFAQMAANLANWSGYVSGANDVGLTEIDSSNNGTIQSDKFIVLTANPSEATKKAAMEALGLTMEELDELIALMQRNIDYSKGCADIDVMSGLNIGKHDGVLIAGNVSLNSYGGGIANNGVLDIGTPTYGIGSNMPDELDLNKTLESNDADVSIADKTFMFELLGDDGETVIKTFQNDETGNAGIGIPLALIGDIKFADGETEKELVLYVREVNDGQEHVKYDDGLYRIVIKVTRDNTSGQIGNAGFDINGITIGETVVEKLGEDGETWVAVDGIAFDNTYTKPEELKPEVPEEPEKPNPEKPDVPGGGETEKPEQPKPEQPGGSETPDEPGTPEEPTPEVPSEPNVPETPVWPEQPEKPVVPGPVKPVTPTPETPVENPVETVETETPETQEDSEPESEIIPEPVVPVAPEVDAAPESNAETQVSDDDMTEIPENPVPTAGQPSVSDDLVKDIPQTGDDFDYALWYSLMVAGVMILLGVFVSSSRKVRK